MGKRIVFQWLWFFSQTLGAPATLLTSVPGTPERTLKSTLEGMWGWHVPHDYFSIFFLPDFFTLKKGMVGKTKKTACDSLGSWSPKFFLSSNLLYKGFYIRVMVFWRFFQDVISMFPYVEPLLEPLFQSMDVFGEVKFCILQSSRPIGSFFTTWVTYKKTVTSSNFSGKKKIPMKLLRFFLPWFIYIP